MPLSLQRPLDNDSRRLQRTAAQLENRGEYEQALEIYFELFNRYPEYDPFYDGVIRGFAATADFSSGLVWVDSLRNELVKLAQPVNLTAIEQERLANLIIDGGRFCGRLGSREEALERWEAVYNLPSISVNPYYRLFSAMIDIRHPDGLEEMTKRARKATGQPSLLSSTLASYWAERGLLDRAIKEWLMLMEIQPRQAQQIKSQILSLPEDAETSRQVEASLKEALSRESIKLHVAELLGLLYFRDRRWEEAYQQVKVTDEMGGSSGEAMLVFAESLNAEGESSLALRVLSDLEISQSDLARSPRSLLIKARALEATKLYTEADSIYSRLTTDEGLRTAQGQEALIHQAKMRLSQLKQPVKARDLLERSIQRMPQIRRRGDAALLIGNTYLAERKLTEALEIYLRVSEEHRGREKEVQSEALVNAAKVDFYLGHYDEASERLKEASIARPDGMLTNDALEMQELLRNARPDTINLRLLAQAELERELENYALAETLYVLVAGKTLIEDLAVHALWEISDLQQSAGRSESSLETLQGCIERYPQNLHAPEILLKIGAIQQFDLNDPESAVKTYEDILVSYPQSLQVEEARQRIRNIETGKT